jgi:hypothetical protein
MAEVVTADWAVVERRFNIPAMPRILCVQPDWGVGLRDASTGERLYRVVDREAAARCCLALAEKAAGEGAVFVIVPELAVPMEVVAPLVESFRVPGPDVLVVAGIEGTTRAEYQALLENLHLPPAELADGNYVNALLLLMRCAGETTLRFRAKRHPSIHERQLGPCQGTEPYLIAVLGPRQITVVPLICSELVDGNIYAALDQQCLATDIRTADYFFVIQLNDNPEGGYFEDRLRDAFAPRQLSLRTNAARFVLANHALGPSSDGRSYVVVPPRAAAPPPFPLNQTVYWETPQGYAAFRIPDAAGCAWRADVLLPCEAAGPAGQVVCDGMVVTTANGTLHGREAGGLAHGLLRTECRRRELELIERVAGVAGAGHEGRIEVLEMMRSAVSARSERFALQGANRSVGTAAMHCMQCDRNVCADRLGWDNVERAAREYVEAAALLAAGGSSVRVYGGPPYGNCMVNGRRVLVILGDDVEQAVSHRFDDVEMIASPNAPLGVVVIAVDTDSTKRSVRSIVKADLSTGVARGLEGVPERATAADSTLPPDPHICSLSLLRNAGRGTSLDAAAGALVELLPEVFDAEP